MVHVVVNTPSGNIGCPLTERLLAAGCALTLLTRHPDKVRGFAARGATVQNGDLEDEDFVIASTRGADVLFWLTPPNMVTANVREYQNKIGRIAAQAVRTNRISRVVHLSSYGAHLDVGTGPILGLRDNEAFFNRAVPDVVHLRPGMFMENFLASLPTIRQLRKVFLPIAGTTQVPFIATRDIAVVAAERILEPSWRGQQVLEIFGPSPVSFDEAARCIGDALGETVTHVQVTRAQAYQALTGMGMSADAANGFLDIYAAVESGHLAPDLRAAKRTTPTSFAAFAREILGPLLSEAPRR